MVSFFRESSIQALWLLIAPGVANAVPILAAAAFPRWNAPADFGASFRGRRIFGDHKTWRGLVCGILAGEATYVALQALLQTSIGLPTLAVIFRGAPRGLGWMWGVGALGGDLAKSFFKRQRQVEPGKSWIPWDQVDWILGSLVVAAAFLPEFSMVVAVEMLIYGTILDFALKALGYVVRLNRSPI